MRDWLVRATTTARRSGRESGRILRAVARGRDGGLGEDHGLGHHVRPAGSRQDRRGGRHGSMSVQDGDGREESVASLNIMLLLASSAPPSCWARGSSRGVTWLHQAGAALLLGIAGGVAPYAGVHVENPDLGTGRALRRLPRVRHRVLLPLPAADHIRVGYALNGEAF